MAVDRFGNPIRVGWSDHQLLWIRAAMTLDGQERRDAIQDIAEITGRPYRFVWLRMRELQEQDLKDRRRLRLQETSWMWLASQQPAE